MTITTPVQDVPGTISPFCFPSDKGHEGTIAALFISTSQSDPCYASWVKGLHRHVGPVIDNIMSLSFTTGSLPAGLWHTSAIPLLPDCNVYPPQLGSYGPISGTPILAEMMGDVDVRQLQGHIDCAAPLDPCQHGLRDLHGVDTLLTILLS